MSFLATLAAAFKGGGAARVPLARSFNSPWSMGFAGTVVGGGDAVPYDYGRAVRHAFLQNPVAQRAVRIVAEGVAAAPLMDAGKALMQLVGATSAGQPLLETIAAQLLMHGNCYVQIVKDAAGRPIELFALRPERVAEDRLDVNGANFAAGEAPSVPLVEIREAA